jgi:hypothetical protein
MARTVTANYLDGPAGEALPASIFATDSSAARRCIDLPWEASTDWARLRQTIPSRPAL